MISVAVCEIFSVKEWRDLENQVRGRSRSLKMSPFDRTYATFYWSAIVNIRKVIEIGAIQKLRYGFLFAFLVNMAVSVTVCEIFSVKEWCDLENRIRVCSRPLEMAPFYRSHTSCYSLSIVTMALSCIVCEI